MHARHVAGDARELGKVIVDDLLRFGARDSAEALRETEGGDAIRDAEVHHLGGAALLAGDCVECDVEDFRGGGGVNVAPFAEGGEQAFVFGQCGEDA